MRNMDAPARILILAPDEPDLSPHIKWVGELCARVGRTDILAFVAATEKPAREYDGTTYTERVNWIDYPVTGILPKVYCLLYLLLHPKLFGHCGYRIIRRLAYRVLRNYSWGQNLIVLFQGKESNRLDQNSSQTENLIKHRKQADQIKPVDSFVPSSPGTLALWRRTLDRFCLQGMISGTLFERARSSSMPPKVIVCHTAHTLRAAIKLKKLYGAAVIYDSCELSPESHVRKYPEDSAVGKLIRQADTIIVAAQSAFEPGHSDPFNRVVSISNEIQSAGYIKAIMQLYGAEQR